MNKNTHKKEIICNDGSIAAFGANLGIILEKRYLSIYQLLNA
jgi:hypothetical protein